jgi:CRISPR type III-B/RAMP module RAMP protein Cmr6
MRTPILALRNRRATRGQHPGLLLQRYLCENATGEGGNPEEKRAILQAAIDASTNPEVRELYKIAFRRWQTSLPELTAANDLQTVGRLIVGLGTETVLETGIRLHHTYGMPILPGSALKGLAAHYCDQVWGASEENFKRGQLYHQLLFGTTDDSGCIIFHDAWFVPDSESEPLKLDVMTPHHPKWLDGSVPPTDFDSPIPVPFLSVAGRFHIAISWCGPKDINGNWNWFFNQAANCLRDALFHWGIGGKTTSGYGRFDEKAWKAHEEKQRAEQEQKRLAAKRRAELAAMSPIERSIYEYLEQHPNKAEKREWIKLYEELRKSDGRFSSPDVRLEIARRVKAGMQADKAWKDKGKDGERKSFIQKLLGEV